MPPPRQPVSPLTTILAFGVVCVVITVAVFFGSFILVGAAIFIICASLYGLFRRNIARFTRGKPSNLYRKGERQHRDGTQRAASIFPGADGHMQHGGSSSILETLGPLVGNIFSLFAKTTAEHIKLVRSVVASSIESHREGLEALGGGVEVSQLPSSIQVEERNGDRVTKAQFEVIGPLGDGVITVDATGQGETLQFQSMKLRTRNGRTVDLLQGNSGAVHGGMHGMVLDVEAEVEDKKRRR